MTDTPDAELLEQFVRDHSEAAFSALVERHLALVHSVALRHTTNPDDAQDITQAVFIILVRKAATLNRKTILPGWLYHTARLTAANFQRAETRRVRREQEIYMRSTLEETEPLWSEMSPLLDEAMSHLAARERDALVLRYFQNKSLLEVGAVLGVAERAAQKRVLRAIEKIRRFFAKRGVILSSASLAGAVSANSIQAAPAGLMQMTTAVAFSQGAAVSSSTLSLVKGALKIMAWTKVKTAIVVSGVLLAAGSTAVAVHQFGQKHIETSEDAIKQFSRTPAGLLALDGIKFLQSLKPKGQLPGIASNTPAGMEIPWFSHNTNDGTWTIINTNLGDYPITLTLTVRANDVNDRYHYTIRKMSGTNDWQLREAWLTDPSGAFLKEFPVQ